MRIFIPFTELRAETYAAIPQAILVPNLDREHGYGKYFWNRWREGETFINIEHDVVPTQEILRELWDCPHTLCVTSHAENEGPSYLACVKISATFIRATPGIFDSYAKWSSCDGIIAKAAMGMYHQHGIVQHLQ